MKFLCDDGKLYYCKYRVSRKLEEKDCLIYEVLAHNLLISLAVPTPAIALVELVAESFAQNDLSRNRPFAKPGVICFGSQYVDNSSLVSGLELFTNESSFRLLYNPYDLVKIAVFDLWIDNSDRGFNQNYNLLTSAYGEQLHIWAFDHAFVFGGLDALRIFNASWPLTAHNKLITSTYFRSVYQFLDRERCQIIARETLSLCQQVAQAAVAITFNEVPDDWVTNRSLKQKVEDFLLGRQRVRKVKELLSKHFS